MDSEGLFCIGHFLPKSFLEPCLQHTPTRCAGFPPFVSAMNFIGYAALHFLPLFGTTQLTEFARPGFGVVVVVWPIIPRCISKSPSGNAFSLDKPIGALCWNTLSEVSHSVFLAHLGVCLLAELILMHFGFLGLHVYRMVFDPVSLSSFPDPSMGTFSKNFMQYSQCSFPSHNSLLSEGPPCVQVHFAKALQNCSTTSPFFSTSLNALSSSHFSQCSWPTQILGSSVRFPLVQVQGPAFLQTNRSKLSGPSFFCTCAKIYASLSHFVQDWTFFNEEPSFFTGSAQVFKSSEGVPRSHSHSFTQTV